MWTIATEDECRRRQLKKIKMADFLSFFAFAKRAVRSNFLKLIFIEDLIAVPFLFHKLK